MTARVGLERARCVTGSKRLPVRIVLPGSRFDPVNDTSQGKSCLQVRNNIGPALTRYLMGRRVDRGKHLTDDGVGRIKMSFGTIGHAGEDDPRLKNLQRPNQFRFCSMIERIARSEVESLAQ